MDRERGGEECRALLDRVGALRERWRLSPDPLVRDLAPRLDEVAHVLARLDWLLRQERDG